MHEHPSSTPDHVVVGLSGGVDSAVAALRLKEAGYRLTGLFMKNWDEDDGSADCTAEADLADARQVAEQLDIPLRVANFAAEYWDNVFAEFLKEYQAGRTPNPDVLCNREIKFRYFADYAVELGADWIATGHYARIEHGDGPARLLRAADENKDQTYFLQGVPLSQLAKVRFPLGELKKAEVRRIAAAAGFKNHQKKDSTGICFIGERRFQSFLTRYLPSSQGPIETASGERIGSHPGAHLFTIGQRQGLGIGGRHGHEQAPWYVADKQLSRNALVATQNPAVLDSPWLRATEENWLLAAPPSLPLRAQARIRHRQALMPCLISRVALNCATQPLAARLEVRFEGAMRAVNPGQYIAFYEGQQCLGGARIEEAASFAERSRNAAAA